MLAGLFMVLLLLTAVFLIVLILIQKGKGGGLSGAFGGMGGQSAFGTKAGDTFTKITVAAAIFWILLCIASVRLLAVSDKSPLKQGTGGTPVEQKDEDAGPGGAGLPLERLPDGDEGPGASGQPASDEPSE